MFMRVSQRVTSVLLGLSLVLFTTPVYAAVESAAAAGGPGGLAWWIWPCILFVFTFAIGVVAPMSGVGGGVLFVPLSTAFFPFSLDFIRGAGLIMALTSAVSSSPQFIKKGLANIRTMAPLVCVSMITSIIGSIAGLWITNAFPSGPYYITFALGLVLLFIFIVMISSKRVEFPDVTEQDRFSRMLGLSGSFYEETQGRVVHYKLTKLIAGMILFGLVGFIAGMFGLGAGWANVPVLNLVMGAPIKSAAATSMAIISVNDAAASWIYIAGGAVIPFIVVPCVIGITIGARVGAKLTEKAKPVFIKYLVLAIMLFAAIMNIYKGLHGLHVI